ncbi:MAG: hypothetical protein KBS59_04675, partial [Clostridiales bacterium]|nr:hypothetical protein [Clostridiales bacterium]
HGKIDVCSEYEISQTVSKLTEDSVHTYGETIRQGYISLDGGYRIGVCGSASVKDGSVGGVYAISSLCIRIPRVIIGAGRELLSVISSENGISSALVYSPPGVGKTTVLRDVALALSSGESAKRVCIVDTRNELYDKAAFSLSIADDLRGYPKAAGIESATRTMCPELIICDEIGGESEARAILAAQNCGVPLLASAHGTSRDDIMLRPNIKLLCDAGVFRYLIGISRAGRKFALDVFDMKSAVKV